MVTKNELNTQVEDLLCTILDHFADYELTDEAGWTESDRRLITILRMKKGFVDISDTIYEAYISEE